MATEVYLGELALILKNKGWTTIPQFHRSPQSIRVIDARVPSIGESVMLTSPPKVPSVEQVPWFKSSTGVLFAPCTEPVRAAEAIHFLLTPWVTIALKAR
ncbi:hypothetical protein [Spirillospora albida]|uniref:hypothetical protein n=1 Tax=Spirillospora albida TaxID=58123 RepID=UPI0012FCFE0E|nr:hypothetical protein [Spirillospora albida]